MRIAEIFKSQQGEGQFSGTMSVFVRASGCNLRCWFCDTRYASWEPEGNEKSIETILEQVLAFEETHVVLTGGEPMLFDAMVPLCQRLKEHGKHITIETAGTLFQPVDCDLMSISPKFASSAPNKLSEPKWNSRHERDRHRPEVIRKFLKSYNCQFKFVIDREVDLSELKNYLLEFPEISPEQVWLMPQGITTEELNKRSAWIEPICELNGFQICPRKHIEWYGNVRGT